MSESEKEILILGHSLKPHALKGGVSLNLFNNDKDETSLRPGQSFLLIPENAQSILPPEGKEFVLKSLSIGSKTIACFEGIDDINLLEKMIPFKIGIRRSELPNLLDKSEFYLSDLLNLPVFEEGTDRQVGVVEDFYHNNAQMVLVVVREDNKPNFELPFLDCFFPVVDLEKKRIEIRFPKFVE